MARKPRSEFSDHTWSLLRWRNKLLDEFNEREGAKHPAASMAQAMYGGQAQKLLSDGQRGCVSKLGGVAVASTGKDKR